MTADSESGVTNTRVDRIEEARGLGLQGDYSSALDMLDELLEKVPTDIESLRLKGNLLELKAMDLLEHSGQKLTRSGDFLAARQCYEKILAVDSRNVKARIDLGDHYRNLDANDKALEYYTEAARILQETRNEPTWKEDVEELQKAVMLLAKHDRVAQQARSIEEWCRQMLDVST